MINISRMSILEIDHGQSITLKYEIKEIYFITIWDYKYIIKWFNISTDSTE